MVTIFVLYYDAGYNLMFQYAKREMGDYFGLNALPPPDWRNSGHEQNLNINLDKSWDRSNGTSLHGRLLWQEYSLITPLHTINPPGSVILVLPDRTPFQLADGAFARRRVDTRRYGAEAELNWNAWRNHRLLLGLSYAKTEITNAWEETNVLLFPPPPSLPQDFGGLQRFSNSRSWLRSGIDRELSSLTLQDQWMLSDGLELTGGLRLDSYSDVGNSLTPRLAGVWRLSDRHILKAQYG